jgi:CelD/BcsL family acetyltransferase involved in cellulose biosynthesis
MSGIPDIDIVTERGAFRGLREEWNRAAAPDQTEPWQSFSWIASCAATYNKSHRLHIITVREANRLTGIAPLALTQSSQPLRPRRLEFVGGDDLKEPNCFVANDPTALDALTKGIVSERIYPVRLSRVPTDRGAIKSLQASFHRHGWISKTVSIPYPYVRLDRGAGLISKSLKSDLARARRKAEKRGGVWSEVFQPSSREDVHQRLQDAFRIEASGWKGRNQTAILCSDSRRRFFERLADAASLDGTLRLIFLKVGCEDVAVHYAIEAANEYWLLNIGYRDDYRDCSPGNLLLEETIKDAARRGLTRYNFLGKEEPWTQRWTSDLRDCVVVAAYRPNYFGFRAVLSDALYLLQKRRRDRLVQEVKKGLALSAQRSPVLGD